MAIPADDGEGDRNGDTDGELVDLLYEGEQQVDERRVADARVVLTSHRLLVFREQGSPRIRAVDRPNLGEVRMRTESERGHLLSAVQWVLLGGFLLAAWRFVPFDGLVRPVEAPPGTGFGGLFETVNELVSLLAYLDEAFLAAGALALAWAVVRVALYLRGRERALELTVAGEEPIRFPGGATDEGAEHLRTLVRQATPSGSDPDQSSASR